MKRQIGPRARAALLAVGLVLNVAMAFAACYHGTPSAPGGDYPPEPPIEERARDAGGDR